MRAKVLVLLMGASLLLAGCSGLSASGISASFAGGAIGFEVDDDGVIQIVQSQVTFHSDPGAAPATVTGYTVRFTNVSGDPIPGLEYELVNQTGLSVEVPAGLFCGEDFEGPRCTVMTGGVPRSMSSAPVNLATLPGEIPVHMVSTDHYPVYALVTFSARRGSNTFSFNSDLTVVNPFTGGED